MTLAARIANGASNLLVSGVLIVVSLTFGRQLIHWWRADDSGLGSQSVVDQVLGPGALAAENGPQSLEFGEFPFVFQRTVVRGDAQAALAGLRRYCGRAATNVRLDVDLAAPKELRALAGLANRTPVAELPGRWQMFENPAPLPMVLVATPPVATAETSASLSEAAGHSTDAGPVEPFVLNAQRRVLSWGLAFPRGAEGGLSTWLLFVWSPGDRPGALASGVPFPLPPGSRRTLAIRSEEGAAVVAFGGEGEIAAWRSFIDDWSGRRGWTSVGGWRRDGDSWTLRLRNAELQTLELQMQSADGRRLLGLATMIPADDPSVRERVRGDSRAVDTLTNADSEK